MRASLATVFLFCISNGWSSNVPVPPLPQAGSAGGTIDPANIPLPPQPNESKPPPVGHKGVWTDSIGDTHAQYGSNPVHGIPGHNKHLEYNYKKHPENDAAFPRNDDSKKTKTKLRDDMIGNKPSEPNKSRDHKPPNLQKIDEERGSPSNPTRHVLTNAERKQRNTVMNLPTSESNKEMKLLGDARQNSMKPGNTGYIHLHPSTEQSSRPGSSASQASSLKSDPGKQNKPPPKPKPQGPPPPPPSPRKTRSQAKAAGSGNQGSGSGTQVSGSKQNAPQPPKTPQKSSGGSSSSQQKTPGAPVKPRPADAPGTPASKIPKPVAKDSSAAPKTPSSSGTQPKTPAAPATPAKPKNPAPAPKTPETPSKIPVPVPKTSKTSTVSTVTSALKKLKFKRDLAVQVRMMRRNLVVRRVVRRVVAQRIARQLMNEDY